TVSITCGIPGAPIEVDRKRRPREHHRRGTGKVLDREQQRLVGGAGSLPVALRELRRQSATELDRHELAEESAKLFWRLVRRQGEHGGTRIAGRVDGRRLDREFP